MNMDREIVDLYVDDIIPNRFQPREIFDDKALKELSASIKEHGVIQPIIVRKIGDKYEIIAGERRYKASVMAGLTKIPAIIRNLDDKESSKVALLENLQRRDLTAIEEARTYQKILDLDSMTQEELGRTMGKSQAAIANKLRLLSLPDEVQEALLNGQISERHARSLLNVKEKEKQIELLNQIITTRMTVRELDAEIKKINGENDSSSSNESSGTQKVLSDNQTERVNSIIPDMNPVVKDFATSSTIDINEIKSNATDIIQPVKQTVDLEQLLKIPEEYKQNNENSLFEEKNYKFVPTMEEETPVVEKKEESPFLDFDLLSETPEAPSVTTIPETVTPFTPSSSLPDIEELDLDVKPVTNNKPYQPFANTEALLNEFRQNNYQGTKDQAAINPAPSIMANVQTSLATGESSATRKDLRTAINSVREAISTLEKYGFKVDTDEMDLENTYQIIIKIDKNK